MPTPGTTADGSTEISQSRLMAGFGSTTFDDGALATVEALDDVAAAAATLSLDQHDLQRRAARVPPGLRRRGTGRGRAPAAPPAGGFDGAGGSAFDVDSFTVLGLDPAADAVGPLSAVALDEGRGLEASDTGDTVAVVDASYATTAELAVGDTIDVGGTEFEVVGTVTSTSADTETAANVYIPLDLAQSISGEDGMISSISVQATSADRIDALQADLEEALPDATVSTQADLAASVSGSLASASSLISNLGLWVSLAVLVAAFLIAILLTIQGVTRRTREFGTLKAIGWSNRRIVGQVSGESLVQGLIGGAAGLVLGLVGIWVVNLIAPTIGGASGADLVADGPGGGQVAMQAGPGGGFAGPAASAAGSAEVVLNAPITLGVIAIAIGLAVLGGLIAGAFGGWRAARLRPAEALRSNA